MNEWINEWNDEIIKSMMIWNKMNEMNVIKSMIMMKWMNIWMNDDEYEWNKMNMKEWWWIWMDNEW